MNKNAYPMISYWTDVEEVYEEGDFVVIVGVYNNKEKAEEKPNVCIGVHWRYFPKAKNTLAPCVVKRNTGTDILNGRLRRIANDDKLKIEEKINATKEIIKALERLKINQ